MNAQTRNILQERADEARRAQSDAQRQRRQYEQSQRRERREAISHRHLTYRPFASLPEKIFGSR